MSRRIRKARGDVQAVSIPSNERRRVGARNGIGFMSGSLAASARRLHSAARFRHCSLVIASTSSGLLSNG
jgi:hypothetical protein